MPQPLAVNISSLAVAENMADLIDGYCRLEGKAEKSLMIRPNKGTITVGRRAKSQSNHCGINTKKAK